METFALWLGFIGSWLLFAGPIYQAALELQDEDIEFDRIRAAGSKVEKPSYVSIWWWLLPPVKMYLERNRRKEFELRVLKLLSKEDQEAMVSFKNKATAWFFVAAGGFCIAIKETYELTEHNEWSSWVLAGLVFTMIYLSIANLISRIKNSNQITKL